MKILYLSCHSVLEYDEVKILTELGHDVFSMGSYVNPASPHDIKRPGIDSRYFDHLVSVSMQCSKENLHQELVDWADAIIVMHRPDWILNNWDKIKSKRVIWRTIGQSVPDIESQMFLPHTQGMQIVRYSPEEANITNYAGCDAVIRFYKDMNEFGNWNGNTVKAITLCQSIDRRGLFCRYDIVKQLFDGLPGVIYGPENEGIQYGAGQLSYDDLKKTFRDNRVFVYTGTYPASYTLGFVEAMMTGIPIVAIGVELADIKLFPNMRTYEVHKIIKNGENGFCSDDVSYLKEQIIKLLADQQFARNIGEAGRKTAISLFDKELVKSQWRSFL